MIHGTGSQRAFLLATWMGSGAFAADAVWLLKSHWKKIVACGLLATGLAAAYNHWSPETYVSKATVRFIPPQVAERFVASNVAMQVEQRIFAISQLVTSRLTATQLIETFHLYPQRRRFFPVADLVPTLQKDLRLTTTVEGTNEKVVPSILISFSYSDAATGQKVVQRVVELIYEENRRYRSDQSIGTTDFLQQELKTVTTQMQELEQRLASLPTPGGEDKEYRNILKVEQLHDLERRITDDDHQMAPVLVERNLRKTLAETLERQLGARFEKDRLLEITASHTTEYLRSEVRVLENRYNQLRGRYPAKNEEVLSASRDLDRNRALLIRQEESDRKSALERDEASLRAQLERARSEQQGYDVTLEKHAAERARLVTEINAIRAQFVARPGVENERLNAIREYEFAKEQYGTLVKRQRESELASDMERRGHGETAELVEPPTLPLRAEYPTESMFLTAGTVSGCLFGYGLAILSFLFSPRVRTIEHIGLLGTYPVLANLPAGYRTKPSTAAAAGLKAALGVVLAVLALTAGCQSPAARRDKALQKGIVATKAGKPRVAEIEFRRALQADAKSGDAHLALAGIYLNSGRIMLGRDHLVRAAELMADRVEVLERLAELTYQIYFADPGRPTALLREVEQIAGRLSKTWPSRPTGYRLAAQALAERHRTAEAIVLMEKTLQSIEDGAIRVQLAAALFQSGDAAGAEKHLRISIQRNPKFAPGYDLLYLQFMQRNNPVAARAVLETKVSQYGGIDSGLQLAAHDDASGQRILAEKRLSELETQFSTQMDTLARIGDFWLHRGEYERARLCYQTGLDRFSSQRGLYAGRMAELFVAEKKPKEAQALVASELIKSPNDPLLRAYQAAFELDNPSSADRRRSQARLEAVLSQMPDSPFVRLHLGRAYLLNGDVLRATEQLRDVVSLDPNYVPGWLALAELELSSGKSSLAEERLAALLRRAPGYVPALLLQAKAALAQNRPAESEKTLEQLLRSQPDNQDVLILLSRVKFTLGRMEDARILLERAVKLNPRNPQTMLLLVRFDLQRADTKTALLRLAAVEGLPGKAQGDQAQLASLALMAGNHEMARRVFESLIKEAPENLEYRLGHASSLAIAGDLTRAEAEYAVVQQKSGKDPRPWLLLGALHSSAGNNQAAGVAYEAALDRDPRNPFVLNNLAYVIARTGSDLPKALKLAEAARHQLPQSPEIQDTLAYVYVRLGMARNAAAALEQAIPLQNASSQKRTRMLLAKLSRGEIAQVRQELESANTAN